MKRTPKEPSAPGRNDPCPCGSGVKFKRCCLANRWRAENAERERARRAATVADDLSGELVSVSPVATTESAASAAPEPTPARHRRRLRPADAALLYAMAVLGGGIK